MGKVQSIGARALQSRDAIELLSNKWRITIMHLLTSGPLRPSELQRAIPQVSAKVLTETVRGLERDGLIGREVRNVVPAHVEYELTQMGESVIPLLRELCHWAESHAKHRDEARRRFDQEREDTKGSRPSRARR